jgi:hypothetical protein
MKHEQACDVALDALIWLAGMPEDLAAFLAAGGLAPADLRGRADDAEFLGCLLDFLLEGDARLLAFAAASGVPPETVVRARAALPGGYVPDWT